MLIPLALLATPADAASLELRVAAPVDLDLPGTIRTLAVGHRALPHDPARHPHDAAEALHSGELDGADHAAAQAAVAALVEALQASERYDALGIADLPAPDRRGPFADPLLPDQVTSLCDAHGAEAMVVLEGVDSNLYLDGEDTVLDGTEVHQAVQTIDGRALWRTYRCDGWVFGEDLLEPDLLRFEDRAWGMTPEEAWAPIPEPSQVLEQLGPTVAAFLAPRLIPTFETVKRRWQKGGSAAMRDAARAVRDDDWATAIATWEQVVDTDDGKLAGRAALNLSVAAERSGQLELAGAWMQVAARLDPSGAQRANEATLTPRLRAADVAHVHGVDRPETPTEQALAVPAGKPPDPAAEPPAAEPPAAEDAP